MARQDARHDIANRVLLALPRSSLERLQPHFERVQLATRQVLSHAGQPTTHVHFVNRGLVSLVKAMQDGRTVELGAVGIEGVVGLFALHGVERAIGESIVQEPGEALRIRVDAFAAELSRSAAARRLIERYTYVVLSEIAQTAACNRLHSLEERCCRWLLIAHDSARSDSFPLTHEFLALMLGVRRSGLSVTASVLQKAGLIRYVRGKVTVTDRAGLEAAACECYAAVRSQLRQVFNLSKRG